MLSGDVSDTTRRILVDRFLTETPCCRTSVGKNGSASLGTLSERKRASIVSAAVDIFAEFGFEQASMDAIAERAQVSKRTVYNHFTSKDELFNAIVEELKQWSEAGAAFDFSCDVSLGDQLESFAKRVVDFHCGPASRRLARVILPRLLQCPQMCQSLFGDAKLFESELQAWIRFAVRSKALAKADAKMAARQLLGLLETFVVWPQLIRNAPSPQAAERRQIVTQSVKMFLSRYQAEEVS